MTADIRHEIHLPALGNGVYAVSEVCRILQPKMTPRKVHYWLDTELLFGSPIRRSGRGYPTLLSSRQLLEIRTVQQLRDELQFSLPRVRGAFAWILKNLFAKEPGEIKFVRGVDGALVAQVRGESIVIPGGQGILAGVLPELNQLARETQLAWEEKIFSIPGRRHIVTNARILGGTPIVRGTRVDTALLASFARGNHFDSAAIADIHAVFPRIATDAIEDALEFEGLSRAA